MTIHVKNLTFDAIIGLLDFEREKPQQVIINLHILYDYANNKFIDYADIVFLIKENLKEKRYTLLENALLGLKEVLHTTYPQMKSLTIQIEKPDVLPECSVGLSESWLF